jgi:hypothetical protein
VLVFALVLAMSPADHAWVHVPRVRTVDVAEAARHPGRYLSAPVEQPDFWDLDRFALPSDEPNDPSGKPGVAIDPPWLGDLQQRPPPPSFAPEDIPGNEYPRRHTLFMNFMGGQLLQGRDNSAEGKSILSPGEVYPTFAGGEQAALAVVQGVQNDVAPFGIRIQYDFRPRKLVPYTMEMFGGSACEDTVGVDNCGGVGGVAPSSDCGALGQRHVVYTFGRATNATAAANTASQEAAHAWGLDHTFNPSSVMSYGGGGDKSFQSGCSELCEVGCQGPDTARCRLTHATFCGEGTDMQDDFAELSWIFGTHEPDMEPPTVQIVEPMDGLEVPEGANVDLRAIVDDNYGGFGWKFVITKDGETIYDQPDYERDVDAQYRAALNLANLETGVYTLSVEAEDQYDHVALQSVTVYVGGATTTTDPGTASDTMDAGTSSDTEDTWVGGMHDDPGDGGGGVCTAGARPTHSGIVLLLLALGAVSRKERCSSASSPGW